MDSTRLRELRAGRRIPLEKLAEVIGKSIVSVSYTHLRAHET